MSQYDIGIDPGHGGADPGAVGPTGLRESDVNLSISKRVEYYLVASGMGVILTRNEDSTVSLLARSAFLNQHDPKIAISVHCNASESQSANYIATFIQATGGQAEQLAHRVQARMAAATGWKNGGVRTQNLHMTRETKMPAILVECGFISNPAQETALATPATRESIAKAIAEGVIEYLGGTVQASTTSLRLMVAGQELPVTLIDGKAWAPVRQMGEALGAKVGWDETTNIVSVER